MRFSVKLQESSYYVIGEKTIDQWNRMAGPEIDSHRRSEQIFNKAAKGTQWSEERLFNKWNVWMSACKNMNLDRLHNLHRN